MASTTVPTTNVRVAGIQVSGLKEFDGSDWKSALRYFLAGLASGMESVCYRPKLHFGVSDYAPCRTLTLRFDRGLGTYYAYGLGFNGLPLPQLPTYGGVLEVSGLAGQTEWALTRFVSDGRVRTLKVNLPYDSMLDFWSDSTVYLWKSSSGRQIRVWATGIPTYKELNARIERIRALS